MAAVLGTLVVIVLIVTVLVARMRRRQSSPSASERQMRKAGLHDIPSGAITASSRTGEQVGLDLRALDCGEKDGGCGFAIVGESNYQPALRRIAKRGRSFRAVLIPEPSNPYDPNAIRVCAEGGGTIGHLSRENALEYREVFALLSRYDHVGACRAKLIGGTPGKPTFGVLIDLRDAEELLTDIRDTLAPGTPLSENVQPF